MDQLETQEYTSFIKDVVQILVNARKNTYQAVNTTMVQAYWAVGRRIVEEEQHGQLRAGYGKKLLKNLASEIKNEFSESFDERELRRMRQFYTCYPIRGTLCPELSWSHYRLLVRLENPDARDFYTKEAVQQQWTVRTLDRNISTLYFERLLASQEKTLVIEEMRSHSTSVKAHEFIRNPYVLDFMDIPESKAFLEKNLESALIQHLQDFLLELGKGFAFIARQQLVRTETSDFKMSSESENDLTL